MPAGGGAGIAVFVNPLSRANRRNPALAADFQAILGEAGRVLAPKTLQELDAMAATLHQAPPDLIAVHGGDGTLHRTVTALGRAWGDDALPPLAVLPGGTMNVVAVSLRVGGPPKAVLKTIVEAARGGRPLPTIRRRCLRVGDQLGFVFGNGLMANFLGEYYAAGGYGAGRAVWLLARTLWSALVGGPFAGRVFRRFEGTVRVDGATLERTSFIGVGAATVREVGLGFKLNHLADDDPERFAVLAIHARPLALVADLRAVHSGRGVASSRAFSAVASTLEVEPQAGSQPGEMSYTIDGDLYQASGPLRVSVGPTITFVQTDARAARHRHREMTNNPNTRLIAPAAEDTMESGR